jgi:uncharacterized protein involved in exopolysaccharide biosynthesis
MDGATPKPPDVGSSGSALVERLTQIFRDADSIIAMFRRQRRVLAVSATSVAALLALILALQTPLFESTALLLVKFGRELIYQPEVGEGQAFTQRDKQAILNSELAILLSQPVMEGVIRDVGFESLYPDLAEREAALESAGEGVDSEALRDLLVVEGAERLAESLSAVALPDAHVLRISFLHPDSVVAASVVNAAVDRFTEKHLEAFAEPELVAFLTARVEEYRVRLAETEQALREFEMEHRAFALEDPQTVLLQRRDEINRELIEVDREISSLRRGDLQEAGAVSQARSELLALELEQAQVKGKLREDVTQQIAVVKRFIRERQAEREVEVQLVRKRRAELQDQVFEIDKDLSDMPVLSARYREIRRERDANEEQYRIYSKRLRDARLSHAMDREKLASINVIQPAFPAPAPVWPRGYLLSGAVVAVVSIMIGLLCATLSESFALRLPSWLEAPGGDSRR